ncbi:MAG: hypothetical protein ACM3NQ_03460 [Bacteroidales bacterium]
MRLSSGGCYEISGTVVRPVADAPSVAGTLARRGERRADLWAESVAIAQVYHTLTAEENGLFNAIQREIKALDADVPRGETGSR